MSLSRQQFLRNSVWTFMELSLYPLLMIVATPLFIRKLGIEQYGLWMLVNTITLGMNVLNVGVGDTNIRLISHYRAEENPDHIKRVFNYNFSFSLFLCVAALVVGLIFYFSNFISIFHKTGDYSLANTILLLGCFTAGLKFVEISILSVFKAFERFDLNSKLVLISKNSAMIVSLILVLLNYDLITIFCSMLFMHFVNILLQLVVLQTFRPGILEFPSLIFFREKLHNLNYNFWYWLQSVVALLGFLADKLMVAYFTDVKTLGYYSIASLIGINIHNFFLSFGSFLFPRVSFKLAENKDIARLYFIARSLVALPGWALITFLILFGDYIFKLWLGPETFVHSIFYIKLYLVFEAGMLLIIVPFYFINGSNVVRLNSMFEVVIRLCHFTSMFVGYYLSGIQGILYGLLFSTFLNIPFQYFFFQNKIVGGVGKWQYLLVILPVMFIAAIAFTGSFLFQLVLLLILIVCCKLIYFDPARQYSKNIIAFNGLFSRA
jgi:O-antigen/teichoic acid export membrane protein